jgi:hypothetical protein
MGEKESSISYARKLISEAVQIEIMRVPEAVNEC